MSIARVAICAAIVSVATTASAQGHEIAITIDDLPVASGLYAENVPAQAFVTARLIAGLRAQHVPAIGFVNEGKLAPHGPVDPARVALLEQWIDAGFELGNHSYSHLDLYDTRLATYETDVARGDSVTRVLLAARGKPAPIWFRHPYLSTGRDSSRVQFERWLASRGYRVAPVTINDADYTFAAAYDRLISRHDSAGMRQLAGEYVAYMERTMAYYERLSIGLFDRDIRQVLLIHASPLNADHFDELARMLRSRGYTFVSIAHAVDDPAYRSPDLYATSDGSSWLKRWALSRGKGKSFFAGMPTVPGWVDSLASGKKPR